jgi:hypothetical protein
VNITVLPMLLQSRFFHFLLICATGIVLAAFALAIYNERQAPITTTVETTTPVAEKEQTLDEVEEPSYTLFGTLLSFNPNQGFQGGKDLEEKLEDGWASFVADEQGYERYLSALEKKFAQALPWAQQTHFSSDRALVATMVWNVIEPVQGEGYQWDLTDLIVEYAGRAGMSVVPSVQPFAAWDQSGALGGCNAIDFAYYDFAAGLVDDEEAYEAFLRAAVDRYDGDGKNDMPGLVHPIKAWEIGNEYDGQCGGAYNEAKNLVHLTQISSRILRAEDPEAVVLQAGNIKTDRGTDTFWRDAFALGLLDEIDAFSVHYNQERDGAKPDESQYIENLTFFTDLMNTFGKQKPLWLTEFGTFSGETFQGEGGGPGGAREARTQTQEEQASWYFRYTVIGFELGVERYFIDLMGGSGSIGGSAMINDMTQEPRLFFYTLQALGKNLQGFDTVEKLRDGQYRFTVNGRNVYALWEGAVPSTISGAVTVIGLDGDETIMDADSLTYDEEQPVLVLP